MIPSCLSRNHNVFFVVTVCLGIAATRAPISIAAAQESTLHPSTETAIASDAGRRRALILVGVPGDDEHEVLFETILKDWEKWLTGRLQFNSDSITVLCGRGETTADREPSTKESFSRVVQRMRDEIDPRDTLWVFYLGHASYDGRRAWLHLPGPDMNDMEVAELFASLKCRQQVFWLTSTCSGWFLKPLSREGRIVITATEADHEVNETEFPAALASVAARSSEEIDSSGDGRISLAELFVAVSREVEARFASDQRAPTEHAQLDDDGDGRGTEAAELTEAEPAQPPENAVPTSLRRDGTKAAEIFVPWQTSRIGETSR